MKKPVTGYRVEMVIATTGRYAAYTSPKRPVSFEMAQSYAAHLERSRCGGRIIDNTTGAIVRQWIGKYPARGGSR